MASELQNSIFSAFDTIIEQRIEKLELDKTVVASIERCENALERKYRVQYKGGSMVAYAQADETYAPNVSVYVSIPQNDFSQKKWILGKVSNLEGDHSITEVSAAIEDYQLVGENIISVTDKDITEFALRSYQFTSAEQDVLEGLPQIEQFDVLPLYVYGNDNNYLEVNNEKLKQYLEKSQALLLEACFRTDLDSFQRNMIASGAEYGLEFNLIFEDGNNNLESLGEQFIDLAKHIVISKLKEEDGTIVDYTLYELDQKVSTYLRGDDTETFEFVLNSAKSSIEAYLTEAEESQEKTLVEFYLALIKDMSAMLISPNSSIADIITEYYSWFEAKSDTPKEKRIIYSLNSNNMLGNPFLYRMSTEQYNIYPIDCGRFKYIESITFYCQNFNAKAMDVIEDIFVSDIEVYGLQELAARNGDYALKLQFPQGEIFEAETGESLTTRAKLYHKTELLTTGVEYYWFVKDGRVKSAGHEDYHIRGGVGWKYLNTPTKDDTVILLAEDNTAYNNVYKCIVVYQETMSLKSEFTVQNNAHKRVIEIKSSLGEKFDFDKGIPTLTCNLLDNIMTDKDTPASYPEHYNEYKYTYAWMRRDESGSVVTLDRSYAEYKDLYDAATEFDVKTLYKRQMEEMKNVELDRNVLKYPASKIAANTAATFECYVYRYKNDTEPIFLGSASLTLVNKAAAVLDKYYIVIENGDQSFQYNEAGVSPCVDRVQDPIVPKALACHLYDHTGTEINNTLYDVTWEYPLSNTLLIAPEQGMKENPVSGLMHWYKEQFADFTIQDSYNYSFSDNQIKCIVIYDGEEITKKTDFYFSKIGDNGTNGTDVVAKIEPWGAGNDLDNTPLTLITTPSRKYWNSGLEFNEATTPLRFALYRRNEYIEPLEYKNVKWTMAGGATKSNKFMANISSKSAELANLTEGSGKYTNCIVKGEAKLAKVDGSNEMQTHYAFYPVCVIEYEDDAYVQDISILKDKTLKHITYNADGRNPLYNENLGVFFNFSEDNKTTLSVSWEARGGFNDSENAPAFDLFYDKDSTDNQGVVIPAGTLRKSLKNCPYVYIKPKDVYSGAAQNNHVKAEIFSNALINGVRKKIKVATAYIPIYMSLNLYGLASLNAWDGNTIEINEDNNYIMAPQVGAGVKNDDNTFTGVVMGKATTYDLEEEQVGLLGYSSGRQSIFLDAKTGNATFGLPEQDERDESQKSLSEGRIELRPGGLSSIANWKFNSRMFFNVADAEKNEDYNTWGGLVDEYDDLRDEGGYIKSIPHDKAGILLSSSPSYISVKGRPLTINDEVNFESGDILIRPGDTFELEINPNRRSLFTIYRHTTETDAYNIEVKKDDNELPTKIVSALDNEIVYSTSIIAGSKVVGWNAITPDKHQNYFAAVPMKLSNKPDAQEFWIVKNVDKEGVYRFEYDENNNIKEFGKWRREDKVGIDNQGRFYTNALKSSSSALNIDAVGAFGKTAGESVYVGAAIEVGPEVDNTQSLIKMFCKAGEEGESLTDPTNKVYISGGTSILDEYERPMAFYGKDISIYAEDGYTENNFSDTSLSEISISSKVAYIGNSNSTKPADRQDGNFLQLSTNSDISSLLCSSNSFNTHIGPVDKIKDEEGNLTYVYPWLFEKFQAPVREIGANSITRIMDGSIANYVYGTKSDSVEDNTSGHILNYAVGSLQFNQAGETTQEQMNEDGTFIPAEYDIIKALQINRDNILLGHLGITDNELDETWGAADFCATTLCENINEEKSAFEMTKDRTSLISAPRIGIYGQNDIEVKALKHSDVVGGSIALIADHSGSLDEEGNTKDATNYAGLYLTPNSGGTNTDKNTGAFRLYSQYGSLYAREDALSGYVKDGYSANGIVASAPMNVPCLIVDSTVEGMVEGKEHPLLGIYSYGRIYCASEIKTDTSLRVGKNAYIDGNLQIGASSESQSTVTAYDFIWNKQWPIGDCKSNKIYDHLVALSNRIAWLENNWSSTSGLASQSWVLQQGYATTNQVESCLQSAKQYAQKHYHNISTQYERTGEGIMID